MNHKYTKAVDSKFNEKLSFKLSREDEDDFEETLDILEVKSKYITILPRYTIIFTRSLGCFHCEASNQKCFLFITVRHDFIRPSPCDKMARDEEFYSKNKTWRE